MSNVSAIKLYHHNSKTLKSAELIEGLSRRDVVMAEVSWQPYVDEKIKRLEKDGLSREAWPEHLHWNWGRKRKKTEYKLAYQWFGIKCDSKWQGLMVVETGLHFSRMAGQEGKHLVYIDYLATAPWNLQEFAGDPEYALVGTIFVKTAIELSKELEFKGRIGLHSLPQSELFYRHYCNMTDFGPDKDYPEGKLRYFELTPEQAEVFISEDVK